jgi:hypothetical protein
MHVSGEAMLSEERDLITGIDRCRIFPYGRARGGLWARTCWYRAALGASWTEASCGATALDREWGKDAGGCG